MAITNSGSVDFGYRTGGSASLADITFTRQGSSEKISGKVLTGSNFSIVTNGTTCDLSATGDSNAKSFPASGSCVVRVQFVAPSTGRLDVTGSVKLLSNWNNFLVNYDSTASLSGIGVPKGDPGAPGADGDDGGAGPAGPAGPKGEDGEDGDDGLQGPPGAPGENGAPGAAGKPGPGCVTDPSLVDLPNITECIKGEKGDKGDVGCYVPGVDTIEATRSAPLRVVPEGTPECQKGADGAKGDAGTKGDTGAQGAQGAQGVAGPAGADAPAAANVVIVKRVTIRSSCVIRRNKLKRRVAKCVVKIPAGTPKSTWALTAGGTRIAGGTVKKGQRTLTINAVIPKSVNGWISVSVTK